MLANFHNRPKVMNKILPLCAVAILGLSACDKLSSVIKNLKPGTEVAQATPTPAATPVPTPAPTPAPVQINEQASVIVLCYHRFEDRPKDSLAIKPEEFEQQMQALKDQGFSVISMKDFLAWRRGETSIPDKSAIITIDDGYVSGYDVAWPILKKYNYPFTMFVYLKYIGMGGKSISWAQLEEMRDAGVDIQSHTVSHQDLRRKAGRTDEAYVEWLRQELAGSKAELEQRLGIRISVLSYPFGAYNEKVREVAAEAGYEACFTVYGQKLTYGHPMDLLGRYAIESTKPQIFQAAMSMQGGGGIPMAPMSTNVSAASLSAQPSEGETISNPLPLVKANLSAMGEVENVEMRISGLGLVPAKYDPATKTVSFQATERLKDKSYTVIISAKVKGRKVESRWGFSFDPTAASAVPVTVR